LQVSNLRRDAGRGEGGEERGGEGGWGGEERISSMEEYDASVYVRKMSRKEKLVLLMCDWEEEETKSKLGEMWY